ncbi:hypothetical protein AMK17_34780 [Streptomyces sp. CB00072]|nr:hypothetical protein AMK17_34780 [Streptomyces sp. CB00072]
MGDEAAGEFEEGFGDVGSAFPADAEEFEAVEPGEAAFDVPAVLAQSGAMEGTAAGDCREDAACRT